MNVGIIIQGPINYYKELIKSYSMYPDIVFSTWNDESPKEIKFIENENIKVIRSKKPFIKGYKNVNLQCKSTIEGIKYFEMKGIKKVVKIRSDMIIDNLDNFIKNVIKSLDKNDISFLGFHNHEGGYFLDYIVAGNIEAMKSFFKIDKNVFCGKPFPEKWLQDRYYGKHIVNFNSREDYNFIEFNNFKIYSLKWNCFINDYYLDKNYFLKKLSK